MDQFLFINIVITGLNLFIIVYAYSLSFFPVKWRKKVNQDTLVGLALIFFTMITMFAWIIYFYFQIFKDLLTTLGFSQIIILLIKINYNLVFLAAVIELLVVVAIIGILGAVGLCQLKKKILIRTANVFLTKFGEVPLKGQFKMVLKELREMLHVFKLWNYSKKTVRL